MFILRAPKYENLLIIYLIIVVQSQYYIRGLTLTDDVKAHPLLQYFLNKNPTDVVTLSVQTNSIKHTSPRWAETLSPQGAITLQDLQYLSR